jgi:hypothetical protein
MSTTTATTCPWLKQVVMLYCDACPAKKMVPKDQLVSMGPCLAGSFRECGMYRDMARKLRAGAGAVENPETAVETEAALTPASGREVPS